MLPSCLFTPGVALFGVGMAFSLMVVLLILPVVTQSPKAPEIPAVQPSDAESGNLIDVGQAGSLFEYMIKLHGDYGPIAGFWWGKHFVVSLASPEYWKDIRHLFDRPYEQLKFFEPLLGKKNISYYNGAEGRKRRKLMDRSFSHEAIEGYYQHFIKVAKETADQFSKFAPQEHIPLGKHMVAMAIKAIAVTGMGHFFMDDKEVDKLGTAYEECWHEMEARLSGSIPPHESDREKRFQRGRSYMKNTVKNLVYKRREEGDKYENLFIDSILDCDFMDEEEVCDNVITFLIGGFHTTGYMLTWCLYFLAKHSEIQEKVFQEIEEVLGDEVIKPQVVSDLRYTRQVLDETMRLAVLAPWGARVCDRDLRVGNYTIPKKTSILVPFGVVLHDPNLWPEPKRFDPDRFSPENMKHRPSLAYQPFGFAGKRKCPAWRFSIIEGLVFLSILVKRFKFDLVEGQEVQPTFYFVSAPAEEVWVTVAKRKK